MLYFTRIDEILEYFAAAYEHVCLIQRKHSKIDEILYEHKHRFRRKEGKKKLLNFFWLLCVIVLCFVRVCFAAEQ